MSTLTQEHTDLFIGGAWQPSSDRALTQVICPATEEPFGAAPTGTSVDVDRAVDAARHALRTTPWADSTAEQRAQWMRALADELEARGDETARVVTNENGMPISLARVAEGKGPAATLRYYADLAEGTPTEERRSANLPGRTTVVRRDPVGVVALVVPWNFPQSLTMFKLAPALAAGCTVVIKPAPETALDAFALAAAAEACGFPPGVINVITGGRDVGAYLVAHPLVNKVAFTGSTAAGRAIGEVCGRLLRPVTLELGGKSAAIVLDDADLVETVRGLAWVSLLNNGQTCYLNSRILAPRTRYDEVVDAVADLARSFRAGDPLDPATRVGPLVTQQQRERVEGFIAAGRAEGGRIVAGGGRPKDMDRGWYIEPTVLADLLPSATPVKEEIFGPVLTVQPYDDIDHAIKLANDSEYGLGGTVWTTDVDRGLDVARRVETGSIGVNFFDLDLGAPFGGVKASGLGRELGPEGLDAYITLKSIYLRATDQGGQA
ncbi:aldehyde dehydrogenase [Nocardioides sp. NBC_00163]|uniref:aldehyde dehydrogenase n=1 Tax=Nocardioides sp. NBC_00163 TaxID=2975999 RepID=UPI0032444F51